MSSPITETITLVQQQIAELESEVSEKKKMVNSLRELNGDEPLYRDVEPRGSITSIRSDQFYGRPLATVCREILEGRKQAMPATDIFSLLTEGGYKFDAKSDENAIRGMRISLSKNTATFHKLPNATYGLSEWYPNAKQAKNGNGSASESECSPVEEPVAFDETEVQSKEGFGEKQKGDESQVEVAKSVKG